MWSVGLILVLCMVLASLWTHPKSDAIRDDRDDRDDSARRQRGGASTTAPTIRGLRLSNQGKDVLLFSKIGLYLRLADATGNRIDWLEQNKASVQFYTNGTVASKGDMIDVSTPTPDSYATVSREHYVAMPSETSLVIDLNADVPIAAVRVGAVESTTAPEQRRLLVETSAQYSSIADATFTAGFVRGPTTAQATGPAFFAYPRTAGSTKRFQSASDAVDEGDLGTLGGAYTIECRFKSASVTSYRNLCDMNYNAWNVGPRFEQTSENKAYWVWSAKGDFTVSPPVSLSENVWYYVAFVMNNGLVSMYLDDAPLASDVPSKGGFPTAFGSVRIGGGFSDDRFFQGEISVLNVYKTALTAVEIRSNAARAMLQQPSASVPTSHISASGIYEYAATPTGFSSVARDTASTVTVTSGLVILIDPDQPASFPGSGASLTNLVSGGGVATLSGTYEPVTILGKKAIHLINTSTSIASNQATLFLPTARVHTISIWYFVTFVCVAPTKYVLDGRTTTPDTYIMNGQYGAVWSSSHYYLNGGAARTISSSVLECFGAVSTSWQHITLVATGVQPSATFNLFRRYNAQEGMDINVGRVTVYDRALSQSENAAMYHTGWSSAGVSPASQPPPAITPAPSPGGHAVFWPAGREGNSLSTFCNAMWDETVAPLGFTTHPVALKTYPSLQQIATYWIKFVDLSMYVWSDGTPIDVASFPTKFGAVGPFFHPSYYKATFPYHAYQIMTPLSWRARYFFDPNLDYKWGYSVPTSATRIALCLDNDLQGNGDQTPNAPTPQYDWHRANKTTWTLWGYPNKNYNDADRVLLGTFSTSHCTRSRGMYKWSAIPSWPSGRRFTHYLWQPSTYKGPGTWWSCPPLLCE